MRYIVLTVILLLAWLNPAFGLDVDHVLVNKSEKKLYLLFQGKKVKEYNVVFGAHPKGHKQQEGDEKTPEGSYLLDYKKEDSSFHKAIHISYPNEEDKTKAHKNRVNPGGSIMIHGQKNGLGWLSWLSQKFNWTDGCIAVTNKEIDEIWNVVKTGTPIDIQP
jgi:murein L,D-transpeptidase YafK